jgi:5-methylcytosine-specific restriction endonuclease McrA
MSHVGVSSSPGVSRLSNSCRPLRALSSLSDWELLSRVKDLVSRERAVTLEVLVHLIEVERRRLHLGLGYPSMFEYCLRHLGYSGSAAARRIRAARCVRDYPEVYALLARNEVTLITISLVAPILDDSNAKDLIAKIQGKSQREVESIVATYRPPVSMRDRARPVCVAVTSPSGPQLNGPRGEITASAGSSAASGSAAGPPQAGSMMQALLQAGTQTTADHPTAPAPRLERKFQVQFLASEQFMKKFERVKALLSNRNDKPSYEVVLEAALDEFLKDHDPDNRKQRREERKAKANARSKPAKDGNEGVARRRDAGRVDQPCQSPEPSRCIPTAVGCGRMEVSRYIPAATRDAVFARDKSRCAYVGSSGKRCDATHNLEIDHIVPYARGGTATLGNLRLLCERHNKHEAERLLGANTLRRFRRRE